MILSPVYLKDLKEKGAAGHCEEFLVRGVAYRDSENRGSLMHTMCREI